MVTRLLNINMLIYARSALVQNHTAGISLELGPVTLRPISPRSQSPSPQRNAPFKNQVGISNDEDAGARSLFPQGFALSPVVPIHRYRKTSLRSQVDFHAAGSGQRHRYFELPKPGCKISGE
jgi:hypothetical protein